MVVGNWMDSAPSVVIYILNGLVLVWGITDNLPNFPPAKHSCFTVYGTDKFFIIINIVV